MQEKRYQHKDWVNISFLFGTPIAAVILTYLHVSVEGWNPNLLWLLLGMFFLTGLPITAGYHRLISHRAYQARPWVKFLFLFFGAGAFENSALKWCTDHRRHHRYEDTDEDPYNIAEGFFWAHMGWILVKEKDEYKDQYAADLLKDKLVMWQHKYYIPLAIFVTFIFPTILGFFMGSPLGGLAIGGFVKLVLIHHTTFFINSMCHYMGKQTYTDKNSAKDSFWLSFVTNGEGYHNFHHFFQDDYRNGVRWYQWDTTKWLIYFLYLIGGASKLKRTSEQEILSARLKMEEKRIAERLQDSELSPIQAFRERVEASLHRWHELKIQYQETKTQELKELVYAAKLELKANLQRWNSYVAQYA